MNPIVYSTSPTGRIVDRRPALQNVPRNWMSEVRVSKEDHAKAMKRQREIYVMKAAAVGMTLDAYCKRFNVKL